MLTSHDDSPPLPDVVPVVADPAPATGLRHWLQRLTSRRAGQRGMTLIEIMVVVTVLALMATSISVSVVKLLSKSRIGKAKGDISTLSTALDIYYAEAGEYPGQGTGFSALTDKGTDGKCFINGCKIMKDPWKEDYLYRYPGTRNSDGFDVCSKGPDKAEGTEDDICNGDKAD
ncbi:MAG: type II secretion system protein GspG [Myxococcota bacterium]|jgi:general secretion pathway protein G|nr:type II secretion system protein GspG [Myxococcota bacterium]